MKDQLKQAIKELLASGEIKLSVSLESTLVGGEYGYMASQIRTTLTIDNKVISEVITDADLSYLQSR